jgi:phenylalanyl-tRNA synthetase beta chain
LRICEIETSHGSSLRIVCGAPNVAVGQLVPVALVGAVLPNGMTIKEAEVRGEKSFGMLCAPDELGLGDDHSGILILDKKAKVGMTLAEYLGLDDIIFEIDNKSLSNRPDLWCHYGIAREIAAIFGEKFNYKFHERNKSCRVAGMDEA